MPRYLFNLYDGGAYSDDEGQDLADDAAVRRMAMATLPEIAKDQIPKDGDKQGYMVLVTDDGGKPIYSVTLSYAGVWMR